MKKIKSLLMLLCLVIFSTQTTFADEVSTDSATEETVIEMADSNEAVSEDSAVAETTEEEITEEAAVVEEESGLQVLKKKFIEGGAGFMSLPLICLILGLAIAIERIISLFWMSINNDEFVSNIEQEVAAKNIDATKEL